MTSPDLAPCGFGYAGRCCCTCVYRLDAKPRCHHLGGKGECTRTNASALHRLADAGAKPASYVCAAFAHEGIALTDWTEHGCCEEHTFKNTSPLTETSAGSSDDKEELDGPP